MRIFRKSIPQSCPTVGEAFSLLQYLVVVRTSPDFLGYVCVFGRFL